MDRNIVRGVDRSTTSPMSHQHATFEHRQNHPSTDAGPALRVAIAHDELLVRQGLIATLRGELDVVAATAAELDDSLIDLVARVRPDVVMLQAKSGPELLRVMRQLSMCHEVGVVLLAREIEASCVRSLLAQVPSSLAYCCEQHLVDLDQLLHMVHCVARGGFVLDEEVAALLREPGRTSRSIEQLLTPRECEVLTLMAAGYNNARIADMLVVSERAIERHIHEIYDRIDANRNGMHSRVSAILWYLENSMKTSLSLGCRRPEVNR